MSGLVKWIERASFFARPQYYHRAVCNSLDLTQSLVFESCRSVAAGDCSIIPTELFFTEDACICSEFDNYNAVFSTCIFDSPYSNCLDPENDFTMNSWSIGHCEDTTSTPDPGPTTITVTTTPEPLTDPVTVPSPPPESTDPVPSSSETPPPPPIVTSETLPPPSSAPEPSDPPSSESPPPEPSSVPELSSAAGPSPASQPSPPSSEPSKPSSPVPASKTSEVTPTSVPKASVVPISIAPRVSAATTGIVTSISSSHSPLPRWSGKGNLLQGYCGTVEYTIIDGPTAYWAPVIGCVGDKPDCCPFEVPASSGGLVLAALSTGSAASPVSSISSPITAGSGGAFPSALSPAQATLDACPQDYHSIGNGCCPSNYFPWSATFGGQVPCYSTLTIAQTPPPIPDSLLATATTAYQKPTSAIINVVYAMQYPVKEQKKPALTQGAKIGIGAGAGVAAIAVGALAFLLIWKHRAHKRDKAALESLSGFGPGMSSTRQSHAGGSQAGTGVREWRSNVPPPPAVAGSGRFHEGLEPTLPNVGMAAAGTYPADWRPGHRSMSPPAHAPYAPSSPSIPEGYSEADSQHGMLDRRLSNNGTPGVSSDGGYSSGNRSELYSGEYPFSRQELQNVPEGQAWSNQPIYHEAPSGRM